MKKEKPLTLEQLKEFTKETLLPATMKQLIDYTTEVLIPAVAGIMDVKIKASRSENLTNFDKVFNDLEMLKDEKGAGLLQDKRKNKFYGYVVNHMKTGETSKEELEEISKLNIL